MAPTDSEGPAGPSAEALGAIYGTVSELVRSLEESDFQQTTRCADFTVQELLFHMLLDAQRALVAMADPQDASDAPADTDSVIYWQKYAAGADDEARAVHVRYVQRGAVAYEHPVGLARHWLDVSRAAGAAARRTDPRLTVSTQGHRLTVDDFVKTLVVEAVIHHQDLLGERGEADTPDSAFEVAKESLEALLGASAPEPWTRQDLLLKSTGRDALSDGDRAQLGQAADRVPVIS